MASAFGKHHNDGGNENKTTQWLYVVRAKRDLPDGTVGEFRYVGVSSNFERRYEQHLFKSPIAAKALAACWDMEIETTAPCITPFDEDNTTLRLMQTHGIQNVRGGMYTATDLSRYQDEIAQRIQDLDDPCSGCGEKGHHEVVCPLTTHSSFEMARLEPGTRRFFDKLNAQTHDLCFVCKEKGHYASQCPNEFVSVADEQAHEITCYRCKQTGHVAPDCPTRHVVCFHCKKQGHYASQCRLAIQDAEAQPAKPKKRIVCYTCGKEGHVSLECTQPRSSVDKPKKAIVCFKCGDPGHIAPKCPQSSRRFRPY